MTIWDTIFKAVFVVAVPITLAVYACVYVGERAEHDVARPRPPRRRPPGNGHMPFSTTLLLYT